MSPRFCSRCGWQPAVAKGLCHCDYEYQRRTGQPRPTDKVVAHARRRVEGKKR